MAVLDWDSLAPGDTLPGFTLPLSYTAMTLQVSGSQDWNLIHHDPEYAQESGHPTIFCNTGWTQGMLARIITDWIGANGWLSSLEYRMQRMNRLGDVVTASGTVTSVSPDRGSCELDVNLSNNRDGVSTTGSAVIKRMDSLSFARG